MLHGRVSTALEFGEVVIVHSNEKNRNKWTLRLIDSLIVGRDSIVRGAELRALPRASHTALVSSGTYLTEEGHSTEPVTPTDTSVAEPVREEMQHRQRVCASVRSRMETTDHARMRLCSDVLLM